MTKFRKLVSSQLLSLCIFLCSFFFSGFNSVSSYSFTAQIADLPTQKSDSIQQKELRLSELINRANEDLNVLNNLGQKLEDSTVYAELDRQRIEYLGNLTNTKTEGQVKNNRALSNRELQSKISTLVYQKEEASVLIKQYENLIDELDREHKIVTAIMDYWVQYSSNSNLALENTLFKKQTDAIKGQSTQLKGLYDLRIGEEFEELNQLLSIQQGLEIDIERESAELDGPEALLDKTRYTYWNNLTDFDIGRVGNNLALYFEMFKKDLKTAFSNINIYTHLLVFFIWSFIYVLCLRTKKELETFPEDLTISKSKIKALFKTPLLTSVFLLLFFSSFIYLDQSPIILDISGVIMVSAILLLSRKFFHANLLKLIYLFVVCWLLLKIGEIISFEFLIGRTLLMAINLSLIYFIFHINRLPGLLTDYEEKLGNFKKYVNYFIWAIAVIAGISLFLSLLGFLNASVYISSVLIKYSLIALYLFLWNPIFKVFVLLRVNGKFLNSKTAVIRNKSLIIKFLNQSINFLAYGALVYFGLRMFNILDSLHSIIWDFLNDPIMLGSLEFSLWSLILFSLIIWASMLIARIIRTVLRDEVLVAANFDRGLPDTISMLVRYAIIALGFFVAISSLGIETSQLAIVFGAFSVGIGFGLQNIFNNLVSGLILLFERPINIDDTIEVNNMTGRVKSIGIRSSNIKTFEGAEVIVPNGQLISQEVINWTLSDKNKRIEVIVGVAYGSDIHIVQKLLMDILSSNENVLKFPEPAVLFQEFADSSLNFRLLFWTSNYGEWLLVKSQILVRINDVFKEENIEIPFPQRDLHVKSWKDKE